MPERSQRFNKISSKFTSKLKFLESVKLYTTLRRGTLKNELDKHQPNHARRISNLKSVDATFSFTGEW